MNQKRIPASSRVDPPPVLSLSQMQDLRSNSDSLGDVFAYYIDNPVEYVYDIFRARPDRWQAKALEDLFLGKKKTAVASCTGAGKDALASWAILIYLTTRPFPKVPCTANTKDQLFAVLWAETYKWIRSSRANAQGQSLLDSILAWTPTAIKHRAHPEEWFAVARTAQGKVSAGGEKQAEGLAGFHSDFLLFVLDEASGIDRENFEAAEGTLTGYENLLLAIGNPLRTSGAFFDIFYTPGIEEFWSRIRVSALPTLKTEFLAADAEYPDDYTLIRQAAIQRQAKELIVKYGEKSSIVQARVYGQFPTGTSSDVCYAWDELQDAMDRVVLPLATDEVQIGVDCARYGDDHTVMQPRRGYKFFDDDEGRVILLQSSVPQIADEIMRMSDHPQWRDLTRPHLNYRPLVVVDEDGVGGGVLDLCWAKGYTNVIGFHANEQAWDWERFGNIISETWIEKFKEDFLPYSQLPKDMAIIHQATTRRYVSTGHGPERIIEPKDSMRRRSLPSPDEFEAICMAVVLPPRPGIA